MRRNGKVLAHVAGPSGAGKTELMNRLTNDIHNVKLIDLDEYDDRARELLGWADIAKNDYTDRMLDTLHVLRQQLVDEDIQRIKEPIIFFGHTVEGDNVTELPTDVRIMLDVDPRRSAARVARRPGRKFRDYKQAYKIALEDREWLQEHGYDAEKPAEVFNHLKYLAEKNPGVLEALARIGGAIGGANASIDLHDKLVKKRVIRPILGGRKTMRRKSKNPVTHLDLPDDIVARLGQEQLDAIFASEDPAGTIRALMTVAAQEDDYYGLADYERLLAMMLAGGEIETEAREVRGNPLNRYRITTTDGRWYFEDGKNVADARRRFESAHYNRDKQVAQVELVTPELLREVMNPRFAEGRRVKTPARTQELTGYTIEGKRGLVKRAYETGADVIFPDGSTKFFKWGELRANPSYTVSVSAPGVNESVEVKGPFLTTGGALRRGKHKLRSAVKVQPKYSVEKNPKQFVVYSERYPELIWYFDVRSEAIEFYNRASFEHPNWELRFKEIESNPLHHGAGNVSSNIREMIKAGYPRKRAIAAGLRAAGVARNSDDTEQYYPSGVTRPEALTETQREALRLMNEANIGAMSTSFGYVFPTHIRNDKGEFGQENAERAAIEVIEKLSAQSNPRKHKRGAMAVLVNSTRPIGTPAYERYYKKLSQIDRLSETANALENQERAARESGDFVKAAQIGRRANKIYEALKKARAAVKNGTPEIPSGTKSKLNKISRMFHGPKNPQHGKVTREYISDRVKARNFSRAGSIPGIKLEVDATGKHGDPSHMCEECTILVNPSTSKLGISTGLKVQPMGKGVHAAGKRLKNKLDKMSDTELSGLGVKRERNGGYDLGKANTQWYTTIEKWSDLEDPDDINYYHEWAEETKRYEDKPNACIDEDGMIYFRGGKHTVTEAGIEN